jgi:hypothetical protein
LIQINSRARRFGYRCPMNKKLIVAIVIAAILGFFAMHRKHASTTVSQVQTCVWPHICKAKLAGGPVETCVWPHVCRA